MKNFLILALLIPQISFSHGDIDHSKAEGKVPPQNDSFQDAYKSITEEYKSNAEIIFQAKCFNCHSGKTNYPWYYRVPGVNLIMNFHIKEAQSHIDMTGGFPFKSHLSPQEDLVAIRKSIAKGTMPPWFYTPFHQDSEVSSEEKGIIVKWIDNSLKKLGDKK